MYKKMKNMQGEDDPNVIYCEGVGFIPNDPKNKDWKAYQEWLALGNEPLEADE